MEALPPSECVVPSLRGQLLRIASPAIASGWAVEMGRLHMGRQTASGEGHGPGQETETRRRHSSCLTVVLPCDQVRGRVMAMPPLFITTFAWIRASIALHLHNPVLRSICSVMAWPLPELGFYAWLPLWTSHVAHGEGEESRRSPGAAGCWAYIMND